MRIPSPLSRRLATPFVLIGLFTLALVSGLAEHHPPPSVHTMAGAVLLVVVSLHLFRHDRWMKKVFTQWSRLPGTTRAGAALNFVLLTDYLGCAVMGLLAASLPDQLFVHLHLLSALSVACLQAIHVNRHRKWFQSLRHVWFPPHMLGY